MFFCFLLWNPPKPLVTLKALCLPERSKRWRQVFLLWWRPAVLGVRRRSLGGACQMVPEVKAYFIWHHHSTLYCTKTHIFWLFINMCRGWLTWMFVFFFTVTCRCEYLLQEKGQEFVHQIQARFPRLFEQVSREQQKLCYRFKCFVI